MKKLLTAAVLLMVTTGLAQAAWSRDDFIKSYESQGYSGIEVRMMGSQAKVQATKDGGRVEVFHDIETGAVVGGPGSMRGDDGDDDDHGGRHGQDDDDHHDHDDDHGRHGADHD